MIALTANFLSQFVAALVVGVMFTAWIAFYPTNQSQRAYIEQHQQMIRRLNTPVPALGALAIACTLVSAAYTRGQTTALWLLIAGAICLAVSGVITRAGNQPINAKIMQWNPSAPPMDWISLRDTWWKLHLVRLVFGALGLGSIIAAQLSRWTFVRS